MKLALAPALASTAPTEPVPTAIDDTLVPGLRLPTLPGLPGPASHGISYGDLLAPPAPGSAAGKVDLDAVRGAQLLRTPEGDAWARRMAEDGSGKLWFELAARHRAETGKVQGWLDTALMAASIASAAGITQLAKRKYDRDRPFQLDPSIKPPVSLPHDRSYPSGHSSAAFAAARVIATMAPELAAEAYNLATQVAVSRVYAGVHFPTDVIAGALLGTGIADTVLHLAHRTDAAAAAAQLVPAA